MCDGGSQPFEFQQLRLEYAGPIVAEVLEKLSLDFDGQDKAKAEALVKVLRTDLRALIVACSGGGNSSFELALHENHDQKGDAVVLATQNWCFIFERPSQGVRTYNLAGIRERSRLGG